MYKGEVFVVVINHQIVKMWMYSSTHSKPQQQITVSGQLHGPATLLLQKEPPVTTG
jgi:hypothetical protein